MNEWRRPALALLATAVLAGSVGVRAGEITTDAIEGIKTAAAQGEPAAMLRLAQLHEQGVRIMNGTLMVERNLTETFNLYRRLAAGDILPEALYAVGLCFETGLGTTADAKQAAGYYQKAVKLNFAPALLKMAELLIDGRIFQQDKNRGIEFLEAAFRRGNSDAAYQLALIHLEGRHGKPVDTTEGVRWLREAASRGQLMAVQAMAELRQIGIPEVLERDMVEAMMWYLVLAKTGNLPQAATQKVQTLRQNMTQNEAQQADDQAVKWIRELEVAQTKIRDDMQKEIEKRFADFKAANPVKP